MYELIVDCTNKCVSKCINCGTNSNCDGSNHLDLEKLKTLLKFSKDINAQIFLGGGCFFCHPHWKKILEFNKNLNANVIIDVPLDKYVLQCITSYPPQKYNYQVSVSLWGIEETHNKLAGLNSFFLFSDYKSLLNQSMRVSFVITQELISCSNELIDFINKNPQIKTVYFHRLMPTGRCSPDVLPEKDEIICFQRYLISKTNEPPKIHFHHTLIAEKCKAFRERMYIDYNGNIYGCGWVSEKTNSIANITDEKSLINIYHQAKNGNFDKSVFCPLTNNT